MCCFVFVNFKQRFLIPNFAASARLQMDKLGTSTFGQKPVETTGDVLVLARGRPCGPFSYIDPAANEYEEERPPPVYLRLEDLNAPRQFGLAAIESDFRIRKTGELKLINEEIKEKQKGVILDILKKATALIIERKSFVNLSLPIRIFEPRSQIERICDAFHFFPHYMGLAVQTQDPAERIKLLLAAITATLHHCLSQCKPFNPLLGETYQGTLGPNVTLHLEHICHHPPVSAIYVVGPGFKVHGSWTYEAKMGPNKFETYSSGFTTLEFADGMKIQFVLPFAQINGTVIGDRTFRFIHSFLAFEETSQTKGVVTFSDGKTSKNFIKNMFGGSGRIDCVKGAVYRYSRAAHEKLVGESWHKMLKDSDKLGDLEQDLCSVSGSWLEELAFGDKVYWNLGRDKDRYAQQKAAAHPLPSDMRFREDLIWLFYRNERAAQQWKLALEATQRGNREKRVKAGKALK